MEAAASRVVFLCYSRSDKGIVLKIQAVIRVVGLIPWRDEDSVPPGADWRLTTASAIKSCERMLVFWCQHASGSTEVRREYWEGINAGKIITPIRLDDTDLPDPLSRYHATDGPGIKMAHMLLTIERWLWKSAISLLLVGLLTYAFS
jgi:hypothetical protein